MDRRRRAILRTGGVGLAAGLAGCTGAVFPGGGDPTPSAGCTVTDESTVDDLPVPLSGDPDADVTVAAYEDFACPHCADYNANVYPRVRSEYVEPGRVRYEHHDFLIPVHDRWSWWVASAARGVQDAVDDDAFFEYKALAFESQPEFSLPTLGEIADEVGAEGCAVQNDAANEVYRPVLEADRRRGRDAGVRGTPTVFVDGETVDPTYEAISAAVDDAL